MLGAINGKVQRVFFCIWHVDISVKIKSQCLIWELGWSARGPGAGLSGPIVRGREKKSNGVIYQEQQRRREAQTPHLERSPFIVIVASSANGHDMGKVEEHGVLYLQASFSFPLSLETLQLIHTVCIAPPRKIAS